MRYSQGDILLIRFPFTTLDKSKKRPVLVLKDSNRLGDFLCLQITSQQSQSCLIEIDSTHIKSGRLNVSSFIKYDKCFTLNKKIVEKKIAKIDKDLIANVKTLFCSEI